MPFDPGTRFGPYEISAPIGAGGMGEVYRARDIRLDRTVAIKVLPGAFAADSESRQRFEHEARVIAALNDPHICTIHDVGRQGELDYLVLEFLEGETLEDRLRRPPDLQMDEALDLAIQMGTAVDRAHRAGIVHRDLKPGNVMLVRRAGVGSPSGAAHVKLLDFGVAARAPVAEPAVNPSLTVTNSSTMAATRLDAQLFAGVTGTIQYMAPEQFDGHPGDNRTDIFAFGCVLYEILGGRKAFDGVSSLTVVAAIKGSDPPPNERIRGAHPLLDHVLRRCLEKDPERRWQSIGDVTGELRWIRENPIAPAAPAPPAAPVRKSRGGWVATGLALAVGLTAGALFSRSFRAEPQPARLPALRFEIPTPPTDDPSVALSADGTQLAFVANHDRTPMLWVRALGGAESRLLAGTGGASYPFWSPDGRTLAFFADDKLKRIDVAGGTPLVITDVGNGRGGTWNADGVILFASVSIGPIMRVPARGGTAEPATQAGGSSGPDHRFPQFLPDGKRFVFSSSLGTADTNGVFLASLDGGPPTRIVSSQGIGRFAPPATLLTLAQGALQAYDFDDKAGRIKGEPAIVTQGFTSASSNSVFAVSNTGVLAYRIAAGQQRQLVWANRQGNALQPIGQPETDFIASPELSPDERSVAVFLQRTGDNDIWTIELARNLAHRVTDGEPADAHPLWDPDGEHVVFFSRRFGKGSPTRQAITGGTAAALFSGDETGVALSWTRDRKYVLIRRNTPKSGGDLIAASTEGGQAPVIVAQSPHDETEGQFSPDGKWVALVANDSGVPEVFVQSFPDGSRRTQVSTAGGTQVRWSYDGREIFYVSPAGKMCAVSVALDGPSPIVKTPVELFQTHLATGTNVLGNKPQYAVARDGRFLLNNAIETPSAPITVAVNWMNRR
jgi:serine/threonine protein kinase/Tol biopolymer transport system component